MNVMRINGGIPLEGIVRTQGAKNAALPDEIGYCL